jgi:pyruvate formate lyase activating enzyme
MGEGNNKVPDSRAYSIEETIQICLQDRPFYEESEGGVTLSGGEALTQPQFAIALLQSLRKEGIHTALETSGYAPQEIFNEVSALPDLLLFDIKHYDEHRHIEGTGVNNSLILMNLKNALASKIRIIIRLPVIPGYNNSPKDAYAFAVLFKSMGLNNIQLLPFHQFGERKYDMLNVPYQMRGIPQLHEEDLIEFKQIMVSTGTTCFI